MNTFVLGLGLLMLPVPPDVEAWELSRFPPREVVYAYLGYTIIPHRDWVYWQYNDKAWQAPCRGYWQARKDDIHWRWDVWDDLRIAHNSTPASCFYPRLKDLASYQTYPGQGPGFFQGFYWRRVFGTARDAENYRKNALRCLRDKIGCEAYYAGEMPCPVPVMTFSRYDWED